MLPTENMPPPQPPFALNQPQSVAPSFLSRAKSLPRKYLYLTALAIVPVAIAIWLFSLTGQTGPVKQITLTNITDSQSTISWVTDKPTPGEVVVSQTGKFPLLPIFAKSIYLDDGDKAAGKRGLYKSHKVTINSLKPKTSYKFRIYQGQRLVYSSTLTTAPSLGKVTTPSPVYGRVLMPDKKTPAVGVLVYLQAVNGQVKSSVISAITNAQGRWSLDLSSLRTKDLKNVFMISKYTQEVVTINSVSQGLFKASSSPAKDDPWPDIILARR